MRNVIGIAFLAMGLLFSTPLWSMGIFKNPVGDEKAIKKLIVDCYIDGVIRKGDVELARRGWHPECDIIVYREGKMKRYPVSIFLKRIAEKPGPIETDVKYEFKNVLISGYAAVVVIKIYYKGKPKYMDYISLYKFPEGWQIVTKIYYTYNQ